MNNYFISPILSLLKMFLISFTTAVIQTLTLYIPIYICTLSRYNITPFTVKVTPFTILARNLHVSYTMFSVQNLFC